MIGSTCWAWMDDTAKGDVQFDMLGAPVNTISKSMPSFGEI